MTDCTENHIESYNLMKDYNLENRRLVIGGVAVVIVAIYLVRLFTLQLMSDDYKKNADSNAFLKKIEFPSRVPSPTATVGCSCTTSRHTTSW